MLTTTIHRLESMNDPIPSANAYVLRFTKEAKEHDVAGYSFGNVVDATERGL